MKHFRRRSTLGFVKRPAGHFFSYPIHEIDAAFVISNQDAITYACERDTEEILLLLQFEPAAVRFRKSSISLSDSFGDALIGPCQKEDIDQAGKNENSRPSTRGFVTQFYIRSQGGDLFRSQTRHHSTQFFHDPLSLTALNHRRCGFETRIIPHLDRRL